MIKEVFEENKEKLQSERYRTEFALLKQVNLHPKLKWAVGKEIKVTFDECLKEVLGEKTEDDMKKPAKKKETRSSTPVSNGNYDNLLFCFDNILYLLFCFDFQLI